MYEWGGGVLLEVREARGRGGGARDEGESLGALTNREGLLVHTCYYSYIGERKQRVARA